MKHVVNLVSLTASLLTFVCCNDDFFSIERGIADSNLKHDIEHPSLTRSSVSGTQLAVKHFPVLGSDVPAILESHIDKTEASKGEFTINTIKKNGNPMMHIVNYDEGGWVIIAGDKRESDQIMAIGESGCFDPENITNSNVAFWFKSLMTEMENVEFEDETTTISARAENAEPASLPPFDDEYVWVRRPNGTIESTSLRSDIGHLLATKWGQGYPWNYKCHRTGESSMPTGCAVVAISQLLYYYHSSLGVPSGLYHSIEPTYTLTTGTDGSTYYTSSVARSDYQANSNRWQLMATECGNGVRTTATDYVGDLMVDVGERSGTEYNYAGSGTTLSGCMDAFSSYGLSCSKIDYNPATVISSLDNQKPVLMASWTYDNTTQKVVVGHGWIADGYKCYRKTIDTQHKWYIMPPDSLSYYNDLDYDYVLTQSEKDRLYPNVYEGQIEHEYSYRYSYYLKMNWGYDGSYDNNLYNSAVYSWTVGSSTYNYGTKMIYNFARQN